MSNMPFTMELKKELFEKISNFTLNIIESDTGKVFDSVERSYIDSDKKTVSSSFALNITFTLNELEEVNVSGGLHWRETKKQNQKDTFPSVEEITLANCKKIVTVSIFEPLAISKDDCKTLRVFDKVSEKWEDFLLFTSENEAMDAWETLIVDPDDVYISPRLMNDRRLRESGLFTIYLCDRDKLTISPYRQSGALKDTLKYPDEKSFFKEVRNLIKTSTALIDIT